MPPKKRKILNQATLIAPFYWDAVLPHAQVQGQPAAAAVPVPSSSPDQVFPVLHSMVTLNHCNFFIGSSSEVDVQHLFMRQETLDFFTALENSTCNIVQVDGPPGIGKTSTMLLWLQHHMSLPSHKTLRNALWYNLVDNKISLLFSNAAGVCTIMKCDVTLYEIVEIQKEFPNLDYVVLDGIVSKNDATQFITHIEEEQPTTKIFLIPSMAVLLHMSLDSVTVEPWKLETYELMINDDAFFETVKNNLLSPRARDALDAEAIAANGAGLNWNHLMAPGTHWTAAMKSYVLLDKYELAGHSSRWMFGQDCESVLRQITAHIRMVGNLDNFLGSKTGDMAVSFKNYLRCSFKCPEQGREPTMTFTSSYIARCLLDKVRDEFLRQMTMFCTAEDVNPSLDDIVLVLDVLHKLKQGNLDSRMYMYTPAQGDQPAMSQTCNATHRFSVPHMHVFMSVANWKGPVVPVDVDSGTAFYPKAFNNGGFDCVIIRRTNGVVTAEFLQVTRAKRHGLRLYFMNNFLTQYNACVLIPQADRITRAKVTIVCDSKSIGTTFQPPTHASVIGSLQAFHWTLNQLELASFQRTR